MKTLVHCAFVLLAVFQDKPLSLLPKHSQKGESIFKEKYCLLEKIVSILLKIYLFLVHRSQRIMFGNFPMKVLPVNVNSFKFRYNQLELVKQFTGCYFICIISFLQTWRNVNIFTFQFQRRKGDLLWRCMLPLPPNHSTSPPCLPHSYKLPSSLFSQLLSWVASNDLNENRSLFYLILSSQLCKSNWKRYV